jgi:hypothetical protein
VRYEESIVTLDEDRRVKFTCRELPDEMAFITAQIERHEIVYSIKLANAKKPLS